MTLEQIRDQLLRSAWAWQQRIEQPLRRNIDLVCDGEARTIAISIDGQKQPFLSAQEIEDGSWREKAPWLIKSKLGEG